VQTMIGKHRSLALFCVTRELLLISVLSKLADIKIDNLHVYIHLGRTWTKAGTCRGTSHDGTDHHPKSVI